jgi:hypothetical protein
MTAELIVQRLRRFLLILAAFICLGTIVELWFTEHFEEPLQLIPFALCIIGFISVLGVLFRPQRRTLLGLRAVMVVVGLGSGLGIFLHVVNNFDFELEIRPNAAAGDVLMDALRGANPLLAPGVLALAATLAIAATYYHPALEKHQ